MIVRKIKQEEYKRAQEFCALAFEYRLTDGDKSPEAFMEKITQEPASRQDLYWQSQWAAFEEDDHTMLSTFTVIPYQAHFDGHSMLMMGIGGVATLPQYRRLGGIRACFEAALPDMYTQGAAFSYLYPFSTAYYRKFGYELGCECNRCKLLLSAMPKAAVGGKCQLLEAGVDLKEAFMQVDQVWQSKYNLMTLDEEIEYAWMDKANPFRDAEYTYLYRDDNGAPKGYLTFALCVENGERSMKCSRFVFTDCQGFYGLLNLLLTLAADHKYAILSLPTDVPLVALLPEWSMGAVSRTRECAGMVRVINVEKALRMARVRGSGQLILQIQDAQIAQNNGCFEICFEADRVTDVQKTDRKPDLFMPIQEFSRLLVGCCDVDVFPYVSSIKLYCAPEKAAQIFYRKPLYINRYF
ncbi:MAG: GNAT family N-acetyltransferase [Clostridia bacterium]